MNFQREGGLLLTVLCQNCGAIHEGIEFFELSRGSIVQHAVRAVHSRVKTVLWTICPSTQEPVFAIQKGQLPSKDPMENGFESG